MTEFLALIKEYIKPELAVLIPVLWLVGISLKNAKCFKDELIPFILGGVSIVMCGIWVFATTVVTCSQDIAMAIFVAIVQAVLCAGMAVYIDQLKKQGIKLKETNNIPTLK